MTNKRKKYETEWAADGMKYLLINGKRVAMIFSTDNGRVLTDLEGRWVSQPAGDDQEWSENIEYFVENYKG